MLPDLTSLIDKAPTAMFVIIGLLIALTAIAYIYYMLLSVVILFFYHPGTKEVFFSEESGRGGRIVTLAFIGLIASALIYGLSVLKPEGVKADTILLVYYAVLTSVLITIIIQETGKRLFRNPSAYDSIVSFAAILIFITPTPMMFKFNQGYGFLWSISSIFSVPFIATSIKQLPLNSVIEHLYGRKNGKPNKEANNGK